jgi:hypothetical protein
MAGGGLWRSFSAGGVAVLQCCTARRPVVIRHGPGSRIKRRSHDRCRRALTNDVSARLTVTYGLHYLSQVRVKKGN